MVHTADTASDSRLPARPMKRGGDMDAKTLFGCHAVVFVSKGDKSVSVMGYAEKGKEGKGNVCAPALSTSRPSSRPSLVASKRVAPEWVCATYE